jgi:gliding motility-associated-like protein
VSISPTTGAVSITAVADAFGSQLFTVTADDGQGANNLATANYTLNISSINDAPSFVLSTATVNLSEDFAGTQSVTVTPDAVPADEAGQTVTYSISPASVSFANVSISPTTGAVSITAVADAFGSQLFTVTADDGQGANNLATANYTLNISSVNDAPTFTIGSDLTVDEDAGLQTINNWTTNISTGAVGESGQSLNFTVTQISSSGTLTFSQNPSLNSVGDLVYNTTLNTNGTATFEVELFDDGLSNFPNVNQSITESFTITVDAINDAPIFTRGSNQTIDEDAALQTIPNWATSIGQGGGVDESGQTFDFILAQTGITGNLSFMQVPTITDAGTLSYQVVSNTNGTATYSVILRDNGSGVGLHDNESSPIVFTLTVNNVNDAPSFTKGVDINILEDAGLQLLNNWATDILKGGGSDESGQALNFITSIQVNSGNLVFAQGPDISDNGSLSFALSPDTFGQADISVTLLDDGATTPPNNNSSSVQTFSINVTGLQDDPEFISTPVTGAVQDVLYEYNIVTSDPDPSDILTISTLLALPPWLTFTDLGDGTATLIGTPTNSDIGIEGIALRVEDGNGNDDTEFFNIVIGNSNDVPFFTSIELTDATEGIVYTYNITTDDDDSGDDLFITAPLLPDWLTLVDNTDGTAVLSGTPINTNVGANAVQLNVRDNSGASVNQNFSIEVANSNDPPSFTSIAVTDALEDDNYTYNIIVTDPDVSDLLTISVLSKPDWLTLTDNGDGTGLLTGVPSNEDVGSSSVVLNVSDDSGANINQNFTIVIENTNDDPSFVSTALTAALQGIEYTYNISTTDPDNSDNLTISAIVLPTWLGLTDNGNGTASLVGIPSNIDFGSNPVTLRVSDLSGSFVDQVFVINVDNANDPPVFSSTPILGGVEDAPYGYTINTTDPDISDSRTIGALAIPSWLVLTDNGDGSGVLSGTPTNDDVGNFSIVLSVTDALGASDNQNYTLTVTNTNDDPLFTSSPITSAVQDVAYSYVVSVSDPDVGDLPIISADLLPSWLSVSLNGGGTATISGTPTNLNLGANAVELSVDDGNGGLTTQHFTITVNNTNDPPAFSSTPVVSVTEDNAYTYLITATDPDAGDVLVISDVVMPDWLTLTPTANGAASLTGTPINANVGVFDVVLQVEDAQGASDNQNFILTVVNSNDPPIFVSTATTGAIQSQIYSYNIITSDPDLQDNRTITSTILPGWLILTDNDNGTGTLTGTPLNTDLGLNAVNLVVTDQGGAATSQSFSINVNNSNDPPAFTSTALNVINEDQLYMYNITTTDPDVDDTRTIDYLAKPAWLELNDNGDGSAVLSGTPTNDDVGNEAVVLNVSDALGANVNQNFTIVVNNTNDPPFFESTAISIAVQDVGYTYDITTNDPDVGDTRILTATQLPSWLSFTQGVNGNGNIAGTPTNANLGSHEIILNINDASGAAVDQIFTVNVNNTNDPPSFDSSPLLTVNEDQEYVYSITTSDPDIGDTQTITALSIPSWLTLTDFGTGSGELRGTPLNENVGVTSIVLRVEDGVGSDDSQNFDLTVVNTNDAPFFVSVPVTGAIQDIQYTYNIDTGDPDVGDTRTVAVVEKPSWLTFTPGANGTASLVGTPTNANLGSNTVNLTITDVSGISVSQLFIINVDNANDPPSFVSSPVVTINEDETYIYNITTQDPDLNDTRTIVSLSIPTWLSLTDNGDGTAVLQGVPTNESVGTESIVLQVEDALGQQDNQAFNITVINQNDPPSFTSAPILSAVQDLVYGYSVTTTDQDIGDVLTVSATTLPSWLMFTPGSNGTGELTGTPENADLGDHSVVLSVIDNSGAGVEQNFTLTVANANDPPVFDSTPISAAIEDVLYTYNIVASDLDGTDVLEIKTLSKPDWLTLTDNGDGTAVLSGIPENMDVGTASVVLNVTDNIGANANQNFTITIQNTNDDPVFSSAPVTAALQDVNYFYNVTTVDPDNSDSRTITVVTIPSWLTLIDIGNGTAQLQGVPSNSNFGANPVTLRVTDLLGASVDQAFVINVDNVNDPPSFTSLPITVGVEDSPYFYGIATDDPDTNDTREITALSIPSWIVLTDNGDGTATLSGLPENEDVGSFSIVLNVSDALGANTNQNFTVSILNTNDEPFFNTNPATAAFQDVLYSYTISAGDVDANDLVIISANSIPSWLSLSNVTPGSALLSGTPTNADLGSVLISLKATDRSASFILQDFTISVNNLNDPPSFVTTPILTGIEDDLYTYHISATDPDVGDVLLINSLVLPDWLTLEDNGDGTASLFGIPLNANVGLSSVVLNVVDASGINDTQNFTIDVSNTNDPPDFVSLPVTGAIQNVAYNYNIITADIDLNDSRIISSSILPAWLTLSDNGNGTASLSGVPTNADLGAVNVTLSVADFSGTSVDQVFIINVDNINDDPAFNSTPITLATEDQGYSYNISTTDPDIGDTRTINLLSAPAWLQLDDNQDGTALLSGTPTNIDVGVATVVVNVEDALGANVNQNFTLTVDNTNDSPGFTSAPVSVAIQDIEYLYDIVAIEEDLGDVITVSALVSPSWLTFVDKGNGLASLQGTPSNADLGPNDVTLRVEDLSGAAVDQVFVINVDNANDAPFFVSLPVTIINEDNNYTYQIITDDPDVGDISTITAPALPGWLTLIDNMDGTAILSGTPLNANVGSISVVLNVEDAAGVVVSQNFDIEVSNTNDAPFFSSSARTGAIQDVLYEYTVNANDVDNGDILLIEPILIPAWATFTVDGPGVGTLQGIPTNSDLGANNVTLRVTDAIGASVDQVFIINVDNANDAPSFDSTPITVVDEDDGYIYNVSTQDLDVGDTRTIVGLSVPSWLVLVDNGDGTAVLQGTPDNSNVGSHAIVLQVEDGIGEQVNQSFDIDVQNVNDVPFFTSTGSESAIQDIQYLYDIQTQDPDLGDVLTIEATILPTWLAFADNGNGTAQLIGTPLNAHLGAHDVTLLVTDNSGAAVEQLFSIEVLNANDAPFFTSTAIITGVQDIAYSYSIATDDNDPADDLIIVPLSIPSWLVLTDNGDGTALLEGTPTNDNVGDHPIVIRVEDNVGARVNQSFTLTIQNINDVPSFTSTAPLTAQQGLTYGYAITTSDPDVGDLRTIVATVLPSWLTITDHMDGTASLSGVPSNTDLGDHAVTIRTEDAGGLFDEQSFTIVADNTNDPPVFISSPITTIDEDEFYTYSIEVTDPDTGDVLTLSSLSSPSWLTFEDQGDGIAILRGLPINKDVGVHVIQLQATDISGQSVLQDFEITVVNTNDAPLITSEAITSVDEDSAYLYQLVLNDDDTPYGDVIVVSFETDLPSWMTFNEITRTLSGTPTNEDVDIYSITINIVDQHGATDQQVFTLEVTNTNDDPVFVSTPSLTIDEDALYEYLIEVQDVDQEDVLQISSSNLPAWLTLSTTDPVKATLEGTPLNGDVGIHEFEVVVQDIAGAEAVQNISITVNNTNDIPVFESTPILQIQPESAYLYDLVVTDVDEGDVLVLEVVTLPSWLTFTALSDRTGTIFGVIPESTTEKKMVIQVRDMAGAIVVQDVEFIVNDPPVITDIVMNTSEDVNVLILQQDIRNAYADVQNDPVASIRMDALASNGILKIDGLAVVLGQEYPINDQTQIIFTPDVNFFGTDRITWNASDGLIYALNSAEIIFEIASVNDIPTLFLPNSAEIFELVYEQGDAPTELVSSIDIQDIENDQIVSAEVGITTNYLATEDLLIFETDNLDLTADFDVNAGILTISGEADIQAYEEALRNVQYVNTNLSTTSALARTLYMRVNDGSDFSESTLGQIDIVQIFPEPDIVNAFTPNGDGVNDTWEISNLAFFLDYKIAIFSSQGDPLFTCTVGDCEWDGTVNGVEMPAGMYYYVIEINGGERKFSGQINLLK